MPGRWSCFSSYIFAKNAYVKKKPEVQVYCPTCSNVFPALHTDQEVTCPSCEHLFDPHKGPVDRATVECQHCHAVNKIAEGTRKSGKPLDSKMYAKLVLTQDSKKQYLRIDGHDMDVYNEAVARLDEVAAYMPDLAIEEGHNTNQVINHGYSNWRQLFNPRQLVSLGLLVKAIDEYGDESVKNSLLLLFSSILDFNNTFTSYKGEGTGAVRHMFAHHILKPERTPLEANVWGTPKSSGSFSTLFKSKLLRAIDYQEDPFEIKAASSVEKKEFGCNVPFDGQVSTTWDSSKFKTNGIYVSCGGSQSTHLDAESVDFVVTDPPFFDNVHYSELADFFHAWQKNFFPVQGDNHDLSTTRSLKEVQDKSADKFSDKLAAVFAESERILKPQGLLVFSYHHSRKEGWTSLAEAVAGSGFSFVQAHPIQSEMATAIPKAAANSPILYDIILVCQKTVADVRPFAPEDEALTQAHASYISKITRLQVANLPLSKNDKILIANSALLVALTPQRTATELSKAFTATSPMMLELIADTLIEAPVVGPVLEAVDA